MQLGFMYFGSIHADVHMHVGHQLHGRDNRQLPQTRNETNVCMLVHVHTFVQP